MEVSWSGSMGNWVYEVWGMTLLNCIQCNEWEWCMGVWKNVVLEFLQLARRGLNVVIMSRSQEKLEKVADEISKALVLSLPLT